MADGKSQKDITDNKYHKMKADRDEYSIIAYKALGDLANKVDSYKGIREMSHKDFLDQMTSSVSKHLDTQYKKMTGNNFSTLTSGLSEEAKAMVAKTIAGVDVSEFAKIKSQKGDEFSLDDILSVHAQELDRNLQSQFNYHINTIDPSKRGELAEHTLKPYLGKNQAVAKEIAEVNPEALTPAYIANMRGNLNKSNVYQTGLIKNIGKGKVVDMKPKKDKDLGFKKDNSGSVAYKKTG